MNCRGLTHSKIMEINLRSKIHVKIFTVFMGNHFLLYESTSEAKWTFWDRRDHYRNTKPGILGGEMVS